MKLLLDTHVWIWCQIDTDRLRRQTYDQISDPANPVFDMYDVEILPA